jgi:hypothetical protein
LIDVHGPSPGRLGRSLSSLAVPAPSFVHVHVCGHGRLSQRARLTATVFAFVPCDLLVCPHRTRTSSPSARRSWRASSGTRHWTSGTLPSWGAYQVRGCDKIVVVEYRSPESSILRTTVYTQCLCVRSHDNSAACSSYSERMPSCWYGRLNSHSVFVFPSGRPRTNHPRV